MSSMFGSPKVAAPPVIPAPIVMPTENSDAITKAQQEQLKMASAQSGRASTILSQDDIGKVETLGG